MATETRIVDVPDDPFAKPQSIQGERQQAVASTMWATDEEVEEYVRSVSDATLVCRERGRHFFPSIRRAGMVFNRKTPEGLLVRRLPCEDCGCVVRVERWDVRHKRDTITSAEIVDSFLDYIDSAYLGKPGHGRMKPKQIRRALATLALGGQSYREVLKAATASAAMPRAEQGAPS